LSLKPLPYLQLFTYIFGSTLTDVFKTKYLKDTCKLGRLNEIYKCL
jgi:hypothetical protein